MKKLYNSFYIKYFVAALVIVFNTINVQAQVDTTLPAGPEYKRSSFHNFLFGKHYRKEWATPVKNKFIYLDTAAGGLIPYKAGGGRQSKSLHLKDAHDKEYVIRSIDKRYGKALPSEYRGTFIEAMINDQVSISHPYAAVTITPMAKAAGISHTIPRIGYIPAEKQLDSFNKIYGGHLYLLEQRPDGNWEEADNLGNASKIISTEKLLEKLKKDNKVAVDQLAFVRARLFDMLVGDWSRHEDQWRWGAVKEEDKIVYKPIPRDRDQIYTKFDGAFIGIAKATPSLRHLQTFQSGIKNVRRFNFAARNMDRRLTNEVTTQQWIAIAIDMQKRLTDSVIENAVLLLPPEVFSFSGNNIIAKLKSRRDKLPECAAEYAAFLSRDVDIVGSNSNEYFDVEKNDKDETTVRVYAIKYDGRIADTPFYQRLFNKHETKEIRLYGIGGEDRFVDRGYPAKGIITRFIGGPGKDMFIDSLPGDTKKPKVYDDHDNIFAGSKQKLHLSEDTTIHAYKYNDFHYDYGAFKAFLSYSNADKLYIKAGYVFRKYKWRKDPYNYQQGVYLGYSLTQTAFSILYQGEFYQVVKKWDMDVNANYDAIRWTNFSGIGNETPIITIANKPYYRMRSAVLDADAGVSKALNRHTIAILVVLQGVSVFEDKGRFIDQNYNNSDGVNTFLPHYFGGLQLAYHYQRLNDLIIPTSGILFYGKATHMVNLLTTDRSFTSLAAGIDAYLPLSSKFSLALRVGGANVSGDPEFYQLAYIGGGQTLRGYVREQFWGNTSFYNSNELRWITNFRTYVMTGKIGLLALLDNGRVWVPGEASDKWHTGYGGGLILAPFNKLLFSVTYAMSEENKNGIVQFRFSKTIKKKTLPPKIYTVTGL